MDNLGETVVTPNYLAFFALDGCDKIFHYVFLIDQQGIYKGNYKSKSKYYDIYKSSPLRMQIGPIERVVTTCWRFIYYILFSYLSLKFFLLLATQLSGYIIKAMKDQEEQMRRYYIYTIARFFHSLVPSIGAPLSHLVGSGEVMFTVFFIELVYSGLYLPYKFTKKPWNNVLARIIVDHKRELKRLNIVLDGLFRRIDLSLYAGKTGTPTSLIEESKRGQVYDALNRPISCQFQSEAINCKRDEQVARVEIDLRALKPEHYSSKQRSDLLTFAVFNLFIAVNSFLFAITILLYSTFNEEKFHRCEEMNFNQTNCEWNKVFERNEIFALVELVIVSHIVSSLNCTHILFIHFSIRGLLLMIGDVSESIRSCSLILSQTNEAISRGCISRCLLSCICRDRSWNGSTAPFGHKSSKTGSRDQAKEESRLIESYLRILVNLGDIQSITHHSSEVMEALMGEAVGTLIITVVITATTSSIGIRPVVGVGFISAWVMANVLLFGCAHTFAKISQLEKQAASMLALFAQRSLHKSCAPSDRMDRITSLWFKLLKNSPFKDKRNCISTFGLPLCYRRVLELNFAIISLYALSHQLTVMV